MKEKGINLLASSSSMIQWRFSGVFTALVIVGMVVVLSFDGCAVKSFLEAWKQPQPDNFVSKVTSFRANITKINQGSVHNSSQTLISNNNNNNNDDKNNQTDLRKPFNSTNFTKKPEPKPSLASWVRADLEPNVTTNLISRWTAPGGEACKDSKTEEISIPGLDSHKGLIELPAGEIHEFTFQALDENKRPRCLGGDYFETDLSGESWKSRPLVRDYGNGSYSVRLQVHPDFAGDYNFTLTLLFRHYEGLKFSTTRFVVDRKLREIRVKFVKVSTTHLPNLELCTGSDFSTDVWAGRWTRHAKNESCQISNDGRYRCLPGNFQCKKPWCSGPLGSLESNGWVYSTHCSFRLFEPKSAWNCLKDRWIFFWGDSNHVDTVRNMLNFVLNRPDVASVPRRFDLNFTNPRDPSQTVRITSIFNGHWNVTQNYQGLNSLRNDEFRALVKKYFSEKTVPDTVVLNSGLHDGIFWSNLRAFSRGARYASSFWAEILESVRQRGLAPPKVLFRSTIATGGYARSMAFNPSKMEAFNGVFLESLKESGVVSAVVDDFDMTFPWHFDNRCSDGVHYGRAPAKMKWRDGQIGHEYFVDLMLAHVLLNALCIR